MNAFEFYQKYPEVEQEWRAHNLARDRKNHLVNKTLTAEEFLKAKFENNPSDARASELDPIIFKPDKANTASSQTGQAEGSYASSGETATSQTGGQTQTGVQTTAGEENSVGSQKTAGTETATGSQQSAGTEQSTGSQVSKGTEAATGSQVSKGTEQSTGSQQATGQENTAQQQNQNVTTQGLVDTTGRTQDTAIGTSDELTAQQGTQKATTTGTTGVVDTLGFGDLLKGQVGAAQGADNARMGFLNGLVANGSNGFQDNVTKAVNYSLSGPGMQGTGNMAKGRVAGAAVGDVVRNETAQRLAGAEQLAGPSATTNLASAGNPYLGQTSQQQTLNVSDLVSKLTGQTSQQNTGLSNTSQQSNQNVAGQTNTTGQTNTANNVNTANTANTTGQVNTANNVATTGQADTTNNVATTGLVNTANNVATTGQADTTGKTNTTGASNTDQSTLSFSDMVGNESASGTSAGDTKQSGFGQQPVQKGGGCYVSSMYGLQGKIGLRVIRHCVRYKLAQHRFRHMLRGYSVYGHFLARWMEQSSRLGGPSLLPICRAILYQELRWSGKKLPFKLWPMVTHAVFHYGSAVVGLLSRKQSVTTVVSDLTKKMQKNGLFYKEGF